MVDVQISDEKICKCGDVQICRWLMCRFQMWRCANM